jgi:hypothetical protein
MIIRRGVPIAAALLLAACGSSSPTAIPPTAAPTILATPGATAVSPTAAATAAPDIAALFAASIASLGSGALEYSGQAALDGAAATLAGDATWTDTTNQTRVASTAGDIDVSVETLVTGGKAFLRRNDGPWVKAESAATSTLVRQVQAAAALAYTDQGVETKDGAALHKLVPTTAAAFDPATFLPAHPAVQDAQVTLAFYADDTGAAALATIGFTFGGSSVDVELRFSSLGAGTAAAAPASGDVWAVFTSTRWGASIGHPKGWTYEKGSDYDAWLSSGFPFFSFGRDAVSADADAEAAKELNLQKSFFGGSSSMVDAVLDGVPGHLITVKGHDSYYNANVVVYEVIAQVGKRMYWIYWESKRGNEAADLQMFEDIVSTFSFVP